MDPPPNKPSSKGTGVFMPRTYNYVAAAQNKSASSDSCSDAVGSAGSAESGTCSTTTTNSARLATAPRTNSSYNSTTHRASSFTAAPPANTTEQSGGVGRVSSFRGDRPVDIHRSPGNNSLARNSTSPISSRPAHPGPSSSLVVGATGRLQLLSSSMPAGGGSEPLPAAAPGSRFGAAAATTSTGWHSSSLLTAQQHSSDVKLATATQGFGQTSTHQQQHQWGPFALHTADAATSDVSQLGMGSFDQSNFLSGGPNMLFSGSSLLLLQEELCGTHAAAAAAASATTTGAAASSGDNMLLLPSDSVVLPISSYSNNAAGTFAGATGLLLRQLQLEELLQQQCQIVCSAAPIDVTSGPLAGAGQQAMRHMSLSNPLPGYDSASPLLGSAPLAAAAFDLSSTLGASPNADAPFLHQPASLRDNNSSNNGCFIAAAPYGGQGAAAGPTPCTSLQGGWGGSMGTNLGGSSPAASGHQQQHSLAGAGVSAQQNDVGAMAAAAAQHKLQHMAALEALQAQLKREVANLLPLI